MDSPLVALLNLLSYLVVSFALAAIVLRVGRTSWLRSILRRWWWIFPLSPILLAFEALNCFLTVIVGRTMKAVRNLLFRLAGLKPHNRVRYSHFSYRRERGGRRSPHSQPKA